MAFVKRPDVQVIDRTGRVLGAVSAQATSIAASRIAGAPCQFAHVGGAWVWRSSRPAILPWRPVARRGGVR